MAHKDFLTIKVVKCSVPTYWYADKIGKEYDVQEWLGKYIALGEIKGKVEPAFDKEDVEVINA